MKQKIKWLAMSSLIASFLYFGYFMDIQGAENLALFFAWASFILSLYCFTDSCKEFMKKNKRSVPSWINTSFDLIIVGVFVWFGAWIAGMVYFVHWVITEAAWKESEQECPE